MIYIPIKIKVGFQTRKDTYTGRLAYVIYQDATGKWRKEPSWESWRQKERNNWHLPSEERKDRLPIEPEFYDNTPTEGFVLNKSAGGVAYSSWNSRKTYCRVYDPRGFEFEITIPNLLYILENTNSIKGKGLTGEFVYGWDGKDLVLIPVSAPEYQELKDISSQVQATKQLKLKDMIRGATYMTWKGEKWVYLTRAKRYVRHEWETHKRKVGDPYPSNYYYFMDEDGHLQYLAALTRKIIRCVDEGPHPEFAHMMDTLESNSVFCRIAPERDEFIPISEEELTEWMDSNGTYAWFNAYRQIDGRYEKEGIRRDGRGLRLFYGKWNMTPLQPAELLERHPLYRRIRYLENGKIHSGG